VERLDPADPWRLDPLLLRLERVGAATLLAPTFGAAKELCKPLALLPPEAGRRLEPEATDGL
jgi:hypothetical protein